jgi:hypothetical protein
MVLLGTAGLLILHQLVELSPVAKAQPTVAAAGGGRGSPSSPSGETQPPAAPGQYKDVIAPLLDALADSDGSVRQLAAATLVRIGPDAVPPLIEALNAKDRETRANAAYVLGHLARSARTALPALARALKDDDKEVRRRAAYAIHNIVGQREAAAALAAASPDDPDAEGGSGSPRLAVKTPSMMSPYMMSGQGTLDPGLLVPAANLTVKPEKESK